MSSENLLSQICSIVTVDVDSMDPRVAACHTPSPLSSKIFCDMTSNQAIVYNEAIRPENARLVELALSHAQARDLDQTAGSEGRLQDAIDILVRVFF